MTKIKQKKIIKVKIAIIPVMNVLNTSLMKNWNLIGKKNGEKRKKL